jgi:hypothetical protein
MIKYDGIYEYIGNHIILAPIEGGYLYGIRHVRNFGG